MIILYNTCSAEKSFDDQEEVASADDTPSYQRHEIQ
jgi:hypothetical protein